MTFFRASRFFTFGLAALLMSAGAHAALFDDDEARRAILELRQKFDASQIELRKATEDNAQLRRSVLELSNQLESLRGELAKLRGQDEQLARDVAEVQRKQKDMTQEFVAKPEETRDFDAALATLRKGEFAPAQAAFLEFIRRYPDSGYKPAALFWLGNAQYALRSYREAVANFKTLLSVAPDHVRAPEAALSIANCQVELKDIRSARKTLEDLIKVYPQSEAASVAKDRLSKLK